jgi:formylglycine-generating enzyme required for sulfatase activity
MRRGLLFASALGLSFVACGSSDDETSSHASGGAAGGAAIPDAGWPDSVQPEDAGGDASDGGPDVAPSPCPLDMLLVEGFCIDRFEAPNVAGASPLVMYSFVESVAWCEHRGKRLCFDDEWTRACEGLAQNAYPYGDHVPGVCNDDELWKVYDQSKLNGWPWTVSKPEIDTLDELFTAAGAVSTSGQVAADHVAELYQAEGSGVNADCHGPDFVFDLTGNVEEWTRRSDGGGGPEFSGSLKGRYWAEARTCQSAVTTHGDGFRFYEIGFRCCSDPLQ